MTNSKETYFDRLFQELIEIEGGYSNHPADKGGETMYGITRETARAYGYTGNMRNMPKETAKEIYRKGFWEKYKCNQMPEVIAYHFFDACVNHGAGNAARFLQRAACVADDGIIGRITLNAVNNHRNLLALVVRFNNERLKFYTKLSTFNSFGRGWVNRCVKKMDGTLERFMF